MRETVVRTHRGSQSINMAAPNQSFSKKWLHAELVKRVLDRTSGEVVGWLYQWNTGLQGLMWKDGPKTDVIYDAARQTRRESGDNQDENAGVVSRRA